MWLLLLMQCVQGEASNLGSVIAVMNPTGVMGKSTILGGVNADISCVSETHLSAEGIGQFKRELQFGCPGQKLYHGWPAPRRSATVGAIGGRPRGVGFVSSLPTRSHAPAWPEGVNHEARIHVASFLAGNQWITGGIAYGYAELPQTIGTKQATNELLGYLTEAVVYQSKGRRFLAGDWNQPLEDIEHVKLWEELGWVEAQKWAQAKFHATPIATCKRATIRDYLFLSPELVADLEEVSVQWDQFADHAVLRAKFTQFVQAPKVAIWRKPTQIDWQPKQFGELQVKPKQDHQSWTQWYQQFWHTIEATHISQTHEDQAVGRNETQAGRASTFDTTWVEPDTRPVKPARRGDFQHTLGGGHAGYAKWIKQVRRLQHLTRVVSQPQTSTNGQQQARDLWRSITHSSGFPGGFCAWWNGKPVKHPLAPDSIGIGLPRPESVQGVFEDMAEEVRRLERAIGKARREGAEARRAKNRHIIFRDIKGEAAAPVTTLVQHIKHVVTQVTDGGRIVQIEEPNRVQPQGQFFVNDVPIATQWDGSKMAVSPEAEIREGDVIEQQHFVGELGEMFELFRQEWAPRWQKHQERIPDTWRTLIDFAKSSLPAGQMQLTPISAEEWHQSLQRKKKHTATGPDGVSRKDLMSIPAAATEQLLQMFQILESGAEWPAQLAVGLINSLEKCEQATSVNQYRPITILPIAYRNWASIRARQCLEFISHIAPSGLLGNIPSRTTSQAWHQMQQLLEMAQMDDFEMAGCTVDLKKCFNLLPRLPVEEVAIHVGLPRGLVRMWHRYIAQLERRFVIWGSTGPPIRSTTGYPEGCALSVVAMAVTNLICHRWMELKLPQVMIVSYVDDWQAMTQSQADALEAYEEIQTFCKMLDIETDTRKSFCWSTQAAGRKALKRSMQVKWHCRELGGHLNFTKCKTNYTVTERIGKAHGCWGKLARSCAPLRQKKQAVRQGVFTKALHGSSIVGLGQIHYEHIRTGMMRGLNINTRGANPQVQWALVESPIHDPEYFVLWDSVIHYRRYGNPEVMHAMINKMARGEATPCPGPSSVLLHRLHQIEWHWLEDGMCLDQQNLPIDLWQCSKQEAKHRLQLAWQSKASTRVAHRPSFQGIVDADFELTVEKIHLLPMTDQGILRCALNGTQFTSDHLVHMGKVSHPGCIFCGDLDSQYHRHWQCRAFEHHRREVLPLVDSTPFRLSRAFYYHGWIPRSPVWWKFREQLLQLQDTHAAFQLTFEQVAQLPQLIHMFADGSCIHPQTPSERVATWGVCVASPTQSDEFWPVAAGGVPGWLQTVARGEIWAAIAALTFAMVHQKEVWLWVDNLEVLQKLRMDPRKLLQQKGLANFDLWQVLANRMLAIGDKFKGAIKVDSHQNRLDNEDWLHRWAVDGNNRADKIAEQARQNLPQQLWNTWQQLVEHQQFMRTLRDKTHAMYVSIGAQVLQGHQLNSIEVEEAPVERDVHFAPRQWRRFEGLTLEGVSESLRCTYSEIIFKWVGSLEGDGQVRSVSWPQLYVDFLLETGCVGVRFVRRKWIPNDGPLHLQDFQQNTRWLSRFVQQVAGDIGTQLSIKHRRPDSHTVFYWSGCVEVCWSERRFQRVERYVLVNGKPPYRKISQMQLAVVPR